MDVVTTQENSTVPIRELVRQKSVTMEYFLEASHLDSSTARLLKNYDSDGNGSFSKDEVVGIILDLRGTMKSNEVLDASNKVFKRMLMIAIIFSILLLTSMFGLSYAVAALTAKINVNSAGVMTTVDGSSIIKTDSTAFMYKTTQSDTGVDCVSASEQDAILQQVLSGSNILLERGDSNGAPQKVQQLSASMIEQNEDGSICFTSGNGNQTCLIPTDECESAMRRRLEINIEGTPPTTPPTMPPTTPPTMQPISQPTYRPMIAYTSAPMTAKGAKVNP